jgi:hypothetical protein
MDRHCAHAGLELGKVGVDLCGGHIRSRRSVRFQQAIAIKETKEVSVLLSMVFARDWPQMAGSAPRLQSHRWFAGCVPGVAIGLRPQVER